MQKILEKINHGLIVSCQPVEGGYLDSPEIVSRFALAALSNGAVGLRIEGADNLKAVRNVTDKVIIGLIKTTRTDTDIRITSTIEDIDALASAGADIIAFDATSRNRPIPCDALVSRINHHNKIAMADCSELNDAIGVIDLNCPVLGTTMSGYTGPSVPTMPDLELVKSLSKLEKFVIAEGRYNTPKLASEAISNGANAVVVGSAITRPEHITSWFADSVKRSTLEEGA